MAFTDHCDVFGAIDEEGVNRVARHVMLQRPSLFNYGTQQILESILRNRPLWCVPIEVHPIVKMRNNPIISVEDPITIPGTSDPEVQLNYLIQLTKLQLDLHPGNVFTLPPEMSPPLAEQHFALHAQACAGLGCPDEKFFDGFELPPKRPPTTTHVPPPRPPIIVPSEKLTCFCLDLFVLAHFEPAGATLGQLVKPKVDAVEIVDIRPQEMEDMIECVLRLLVKFVVLPKLADAITAALPGMLSKLNDLASLTIVPTPTPATVPNNPAVEGDQLKLFLNIEEV